MHHNMHHTMSIAYQDDELILTDITITESVIIDSIRELSSNSAAGLDGIPSSLLLYCAHELAPSLIVLFKQSLLSGGIALSLKRDAIVPVSSRVIEQSLATIAPYL